MKDTELLQIALMLAPPWQVVVRYGCPLNRLDINLNGSSLSIMGRTASMNTIQLE
jgi:hypothetical protein